MSDLEAINVEILNVLEEGAKSQLLPEHVKELLKALQQSLCENPVDKARVRQLAGGLSHWYFDGGFKEVALHRKVYDIASALK